MAIRRGVLPDGRSVLVMPSHSYAIFNDDKIASIIGYLRSLKPQGTASPERRLGFKARLALVMGILKPEASAFADTTPALDLGHVTRGGGIWRKWSVRRVTDESERHAEGSAARPRSADRRRLRPWRVPYVDAYRQGSWRARGRRDVADRAWKSIQLH